MVSLLFPRTGGVTLVELAHQTAIKARAALLSRSVKVLLCGVTILIRIQRFLNPFCSKIKKIKVQKNQLSSNNNKSKAKERSIAGDSNNKYL